MIEYNSFQKLHMFKRFVRVFQNYANNLTICLWALYRDALFKMIDLFNMTQTVRSFICGWFIVNFSLKWIDFLKWLKPSHHLFMDASSRLSLSKESLFNMTQTFRNHLHYESALEWLNHWKVIERNMKNAFECFQNLNFCISFKFDDSLTNKNMSFY